MDSMVAKTATILVHTHTQIGEGLPSLWAQQRVQTWKCMCSTTPIYKSHGLKTNESYCPHVQYSTCTGSQIGWKNSRTHSRWHWGRQWSVSPMIIVLEDERSEVEKGVEEGWGRGQRTRREGEKKLRVIEMHKAWLLSFWDAWSVITLTTTSYCFFFFWLYWFSSSVFVLQEARDAICFNLLLLFFFVPAFKKTILWTW